MSGISSQTARGLLENNLSGNVDAQNAYNASKLVGARPITRGNLDWGNNSNSVTTDAQNNMSMQQMLESARQNKMPTGYNPQDDIDLNARNALEQARLEAAWSKNNPVVNKQSIWEQGRGLLGF